MKRYLIGIMSLLVAGTVIAATFTDVNTRDYQGETGTKALTAAIDTNNALFDEGAGTVATGVTATVSSTETFGTINKTTIVCDDVPVAVTDLTGSTNSCGGVKIYDFPAGQIYVLGFQVENFTFKTNATIDNAHGGDYAFGTAVGAGPDLTTTEMDLTDAKISIDTITNVVDAVSAFDSVAESVWDGTSTAVDVYLNVLLDGGDIDATTTNTVDATVTIQWVNIGDL